MKNLKGLPTRQIPKIEKICANKKYHDILYGYLQDHSQWDGIQGHRRYIDKSLINFSQIGKLLGISRQTASTKFQNLVKLGLVTDAPDQEGRYYLTILPAEVAGLIPEPTLKLIIDTLSEHCISAYLYLLLRYIANEEEPYTFLLTDIKKHIGICTTTRSNDQVITNILFVLQRIGLIKYSLTTLQQDNVDYKDVKTVYRIDFLTNYIEFEGVKNLDGGC